MAVNDDPWGTPAPPQQTGQDPWATPAPAPTPAPDPWGVPVASPAPVSTSSDGWGTPTRENGRENLSPGAGWGDPAPQSFEAETNGHDTSLTTTPTPDAWESAMSDGRIYANASKNNVPDAAIVAPTSEAWDENSAALSRVMGNDDALARAFDLKQEYVEGPDAWPVDSVGSDFPRYFWHAESESGVIAHTDEEAEKFANDGCDEVTAEEYVEREKYRQREEEWRATNLHTAEERANIVNSFKQTRGQEYVVSQDGELDRTQEVFGKEKPTGFYVCYRKASSILHAVLSGPYMSQSEAYMRADAAFARMIEDEAFKLAFEKKFDRQGIYVDEIPLERRQKGAYGLLA